MPAGITIRTRMGTAAEWAATNPILSDGEPGLETDTKKTKYGDGVTAWNNLAYSTCPVDGDNVSLQVKRDTDANLSTLTTPLLSGQLVYGQTTGKTVIGDGESLFDELPDLKKQFQNVVTVSKSGKKGSADFICSDSRWSGSDAACFQAAINYCSSKNLKELWILDGAYTLTTQVSCTKSINVRGVGNVSITVNTGSQNPGLYFSGSQITTQLIASDAAQHALFVTVADGSSIQAGDLLLFYNSDLWAPNDLNVSTLKTGELYYALSVSGTTVNLNEGLLRAYPTSKTSTVVVYRPIEVHLENIKIFNSTSTANTQNVFMQYCAHSTVQNCEMGNGRYVGLGLWTCYDVKVSNCNIHDIEMDGLGYGILIANASAAINIYGNDIERCRHCISGGSSTLIGLVRDVSIDNNYMTGAVVWPGYVVDAHPTVINYTVKNNTIHSCSTTSAFGDGTYNSTFINNKVYGGTYAVTRRGFLNGGNITITDNQIESAGIFSNEAGSTSVKDSIIISDNKCSGCTYNGIILHMQGIRRINIENNQIDSCGVNGIYINLHQQVAGVFEANVINNIINNVQQSGIVLQCNSASHLLRALVSENSTNNVNQNNGSNNGITLIDVTNSKIVNNVIYDDSGKMNYGIYEQTYLVAGCDYNHILNNTIGGGHHTIYKQGANDIITGNPGYKTENTGTATISASTTSVVVNHGLVAAPTKYFAFPSANLGNCWIDTVTTTQMTIHCSSAPASNTIISWSANV